MSNDHFAEDKIFKHWKSLKRIW